MGSSALGLAEPADVVETVCPMLLGGTVALYRTLATPLAMQAKNIGWTCQSQGSEASLQTLIGKPEEN